MNQINRNRINEPLLSKKTNLTNISESLIYLMRNNINQNRITSSLWNGKKQISYIQRGGGDLYTSLKTRKAINRNRITSSSLNWGEINLIDPSGRLIYLMENNIDQNRVPSSSLNEKENLIDPSGRFIYMVIKYKWNN